MQKINLLILTLFISVISFGQRIETVYLNPKDSTTDMYIAVLPENGQVKSFMFLLDGFGNYSPQNLLIKCFALFINANRSPIFPPKLKNATFIKFNNNEEVIKVT